MSIAAPSPSPTSDLEDIRQALAGLIARFARSPGAFQTDLAGLRLVRREAPSSLSCTFYEPALTVVAQGSKRVFVGTQCLTYDQANYLLTSVELPASSCVAEASPKRPFLALALRLDLPIVGELIAETNAPPTVPRSGRGLGRVLGLGVSPVSAELLDATLRLVRLLEAPQDIPVLAPLIEREIVYRLLMGDQAARLRGLAISNSQTAQVARAVAWLKKHFSEPLYVDELAKVAGMSTSSLHHHFKVITAQSPLQYQKRLRLQEARKLMLTGIDAASASYEVGYESPSHFGRDYGRMYGTSPGKDPLLRRKDLGSPV